MADNFAESIGIEEWIPLCIWLNGGNAFRFKDLNLESLKKIEEDPYKQDELEKALMELVVKTLNDNIDALVKKIAEE